MKANKYDAILVGISVLNAIISFFILSPISTYDTTTYLSSWDIWSAGDIDSFRTPLYPLILHLSQIISSHSSLRLVVAIQWIIYIIAMVIFRRTLVKLGIKPIFAFALVLIGIGMTSTVLRYNHYILTESLSLSGMMLWCTLLLSCLHAPTTRKSIAFILLILALIMLRPSNLILLPATGLGAVICVLQSINRKFWLIIGCSIAVICGLVLVYSYEVKERTGIFSPSVVSLHNKYFCDRFGGITDPSTLSSPALRDTLTRQINAHGMNSQLLMEEEIKTIVRMDGYTALDELVQRSRAENKYKNNKLTLLRAYNIGLTSVGIFPFIDIIYLLVIVFTISLYHHRNKDREHTVFNFSILIAVTLCLGLIILNGPGEWDRLSLGAYPLYLVMLGEMITRWTRKAV